jgi:site-specific DNA recombinase
MTLGVSRGVDDEIDAGGDGRYDERLPVPTRAIPILALDAVLQDMTELATPEAATTAALLPSPSPASRAKQRRPRLVLASEAETDSEPVLVGVYIRVSTAREEMISPELQQRDVDAFLHRMTLQSGRLWRSVVVEQDLDISGRSFARAGIQRLMEMVRAGKVTAIVTYRYDRFGRNLRQALDHLEEVETLGGQVVSATEPLDATTAIGNYMRSQTLAMADLQSRQIGEGWKRVLDYRVSQGLPPNGRERFGYLAHRSTQRRNDGAWRICPQGCEAGRCTTGYVPDPETAPTVQRIYREYVQGRGFQAIARGLNGDQIQPPGRVAALRSGNESRISKTVTTVWTANAVIELADAGFAAGLVPYKAKWYPGAHEALISDEEWSAYQRRRDAQRQVPTKARSPRWSLAGIAVCDECDGPVYCSSSSRGFQYHLWCGKYRNAGLCVGVHRTRAAVEAAVCLWLERYADQLDCVTDSAYAQQSARPPQDSATAGRRRLTKIIERVPEQMTRLLDAYTDGAVDLAEYKAKRDQIQNDVAVAQRRLGELAQPQPTAPSPDAVRGFASTWPGLSPECRHDVLLALIREVRVCKNKDVIIVPRWTDEPVTVTFTKNRQVPSRHGVPPKTDAQSASPYGA